MGRYYDGDIEGKFWFAVQSSDDAAFFGGNDEEVEDEDTKHVYAIQYFFDKEDMESIDDGLKTCRVKMEPHQESLDLFFERENGYNDEMVAKALGIDKDKVKSLLEWYARYELGMKIKYCVERTGQCSFSAEL
jgi:hypothetical protein